MIYHTKPIKELKHPGFILFEGMDFTGKTSITKNVVDYLRKNIELNTEYNHNNGFVEEGVVNDHLLSKMTPREKSEYVLQCYLHDTLPGEPMKFIYVMQDRHIPSIIFYSIYRGGMKLEETTDFMDRCIKPKHIFLMECGYEEQLKRAESRKILTELERKCLSSARINDQFKEMYRKIIEVYKIPCTRIDTTSLSDKESLERCIKVLMDTEILVQGVSVNDLFVDFESRVYESTVNLRQKEIELGKNIKPIVITNKMNKKGRYISVINNVRHRAYAAWRAGLKEVPAYVNYQPINEIDFSLLKHISEFTFKV